MNPMVTAGGEPPDAAALWPHAAEDRRVAVAGWIEGWLGWGQNRSRQVDTGTGVSRIRGTSNGTRFAKWSKGSNRQACPSPPRPSAGRRFDAALLAD